MEIDIYTHWEGQSREEEAAQVAGAFHPHLHNKLVQEALAKITDKFQSPAHFGPQAVADFDDLPPGDDRDLRVRDAFERVNDFLHRLKGQ